MLFPPALDIRKAHAGERYMMTALSPAATAALVPDDATIMIGGFMGVGSPHRIIGALVARGARGLTIIANDTARPGVASAS